MYHEKNQHATSLKKRKNNVEQVYLKKQQYGASVT